MVRRKGILLLILLVLVITWTAAANGLVEQKGVLSGKVMAEGLATSGMKVREGDVLVLVDTITGPLPAVRATVDGTVREVLVKPGDVVRTGDVLIKIEPVRK